MKCIYGNHFNAIVIEQLNPNNQPQETTPGQSIYSGQPIATNS